MASPISELAPGMGRPSPMYQPTYPMSMPQVPQPSPGQAALQKSAPAWSVGAKGNYFLQAFIVFLIVTAIVWFILWIVKPAAFMKKDANGKPTNQVDMGRIFLAAIIVGIFAGVIYWLVKWCR